MKKLWKEGFRMWDEYRQEHFTLRAIIFVTINDSLALFSMNGQIKWKMGCVVCCSWGVAEIWNLKVQGI
jgi:hypothetical protein